jgi:hypothetical protein
MRIRLSIIARSTLAVAAFCIVHATAQAAGWFDDFNDMNIADNSPVTWTFNEIGFTPGIYTAATGDFALSAPGEGGNNDSLIASVNTSLANTYVRTQTISLPGPAPEDIGGNVGVVARWDPSSVSGYVAILDDAGQLELLRADFGQPVDLVDSIPGTGFDAIEDVIIELDVVGDQLSVFAWRPGDAKPAEPLATAQDGTYASGRAGIIFNEDDDNTTGLFRWAAAQDAPFVEGVAGDYDGDSDVDGADLLIWQRDLGSTTNLAADGNNNGTVDGPDLDLWTANFGEGGGGGIAAVPEPAGLAMVLLAVLATAAARGCRVDAAEGPVTK